MKAELQGLAATFARARFPAAAPPIYQIRLPGGEVWTWSRAGGLVPDAAPRPTCVLEIDLPALGELLAGTTNCGALHAAGRAKAGGLLSDVLALAMAFDDPLQLRSLAAGAFGPGRRAELRAECGSGVRELAGDAGAPRVEALLDAWLHHTVAECRIDQWTMVDVPGLDMQPWVPAETLGIEDLVAAAFDDLRAEAEELAAGKVLAPRYGCTDPSQPPLGQNPSGWRHWNLIEAFEWMPARCAPFPRTHALLAEVATRLTPIHAGFIVLGPGEVISEHTDGVGWALSYSHGLIVPDGCYLKVAGEARDHRERRSQLFNDSFVHSAANHGDRTRVLFSLVCVNPAFSRLEAACLRRATRILPPGAIFYPR